MKRSEMLKKIKDVLLQMDDVVLLSDHWPNEILKAIQEAGMIPPRAEYSVAGQKFSDHFWEPENETDSSNASKT